MQQPLNYEWLTLGDRTYHVPLQPLHVHDREKTDAVEEVVPVPASCMGLVMGAKSRKIKEMQSKYNVAITAKSEKLVIKGAPDDVAGAIACVMEVVDRSQPYTHYISLPMPDNKVRDAFNLFVREVSSNPKLAVDEAAYQHDTRLHITLLMLRLPTESALERAKVAFKGLAPTIYDAVGTTTLKVQLKGVDVLDENPKEANILATFPSNRQAKDKMIEITRALVTKFGEIKIFGPEELLKQRLVDSMGEIHPLHHVTLLNTKFGTRKNIDMSEITKLYKSHDFGTCRIPAVTFNNLATSEVLMTIALP